PGRPEDRHRAPADAAGQLVRPGSPRRPLAWHDSSAVMALVGIDERPVRRAFRLRWIGRRAGVLLELAALVGLVVVAAQLRLANVYHFSGSFDEGIRMEQLLLMEHGFRPYRDIFASQGPLLLED